MYLAEGPQWSGIVQEGDLPAELRMPVWTQALESKPAQ